MAYETHEMLRAWNKINKEEKFLDIWSIKKWQYLEKKIRELENIFET